MNFPEFQKAIELSLVEYAEDMRLAADRLTKALLVARTQFLEEQDVAANTKELR